MATRQQLIRRAKKRCHDLWSKAVRARDNNRCILCGKTEGLNAHHWIVHAAGSLGTRFLLGNGVALCYGCHIFKVHARGDAQYMDQIKSYMIPKFISQEEYEIIKIKGNQICKMGLDDLLAVEDGFKILVEKQNSWVKFL